MKKDFIKFGSKKISFEYEYKNVKNLNLKVNIEGKVSLSLPTNVSLVEAKEFISNKAQWIIKQQEYYSSFENQKENITFEDGETVYLLGKQYMMRISQAKKESITFENKYLVINVKEEYIYDKKHIAKVYNSWLKSYAGEFLNDKVITYQELLNKYNIKKPQIEIRQMKSRWGSCIQSTNKVIFNLNLIKAPICCVEYVVLHELSHFKYHSHNNDFYNFLTVLMPDWKERKKILDEEFMGVVK